MLADCLQNACVNAGKKEANMSDLDSPQPVQLGASRSTHCSFAFADDSLVANEPWVIERGAKVDGCSKRYSLFWETDRAHIAFLPTCGYQCSVLSLNYVCVIENPTRRQVRMMLRAIGLYVE